MEFFDLLMLMTLLIATVWGAWKGLAWQIASGASIVLSYFVSTQLRGPLAKYLSDEPRLWHRGLAMLALFLITSLLVWVAFRFVRDMIDQARLRDWDRHTGAVVGFLKGCALCVLITLFGVSLFGEARRDAILSTPSAQVVVWMVDRFKAFAPTEMVEALHRIKDHAPAGNGSELADAKDPSGTNELDPRAGAGPPRAAIAAPPGDTTYDRWSGGSPTLREPAPLRPSFESPSLVSPREPSQPLRDDRYALRDPRGDFGAGGSSSSPASPRWLSGLAARETAPQPAPQPAGPAPPPTSNALTDGPAAAAEPNDPTTPSDEAVLKALEQGDPPAGSGSSVVRQNVRIHKERIADEAGPPQFIPMVGRAALHHARFRCTVISDKAVRSDSGAGFNHTFRNLAEEVVIDHLYHQLVE